MRKAIGVLIMVIISMSVSAQDAPLKENFTFHGDFRFRAEQDWDSRKTDGTYRNDRSRLRYRVRVGLKYNSDWAEVGLRIRTGDPRKQQDPQLTLGDGFKEFGLLPVGLVKAYLKGKWTTFQFWVGKNEFPFSKSNELFWSDNVYPEGVAFVKGFKTNSSFLDSIDVRAGHFIVSANGQSFEEDAFFQGYQLYTAMLDRRIEFFPSFYLFRNISDKPDGGGTYDLDYALLHLGTKVKLFENRKVKLEFDYYDNFEDYAENDSIPVDFINQNSGMVIGLAYGGLKNKGDWLVKATYANLEKYAAVDFLAQNDWARWDYSSTNSPDGRLTNFNGIEIVGGYVIDDDFSFKVKYYMVEQLIPTGSFSETGNRIRFDIDYKF